MSYDRADWHSGGDFPPDLPEDAGGTHIGMFLAWAIHNDLHGEEHREESVEQVAAVLARAMTGREFLFQCCDGKFWDDDLNLEGNAFAKWYYRVSGAPRYFDDYDRVLAAGLPSTYHVQDSWANYDRIAPVISGRFREWKTRKPPLWRRLLRLKDEA